MMSVKVLIVDDHPLTRKGIRDLLNGYNKEFEVVGEAGSGGETISLIPRLEPEVILLDLFMQNGDGVETTKTIHDQFPRIKVLILSMSDNEQDFLRAIEAGACGYLLKNITAEQLIRYMRSLTDGDSPFSPVMASRLLEEFRKSIKNARTLNDPMLSQREKEILQYASEGFSNKEIASRCYISETTVKAHFRNIMEKLDVRSRAGAVGRAMEKGILSH
jgi:DNA-binding NarL/FixJ family response regulator